MIKKFMFLLVFTIAFVNINSQNSFISLKKVTVLGATDTVNNAPILIDVNGNVVVSGNQKVSATQYDASTAQQLSNGVMTWSNSFNVSTQKAWVTANCTDGSGKIYVTGGVATGTTNGVDLFVVKYNSAGAAIWTYTYNGPNSTTDGGTAIALDGLGDVYVCGASDGTLTGLPDYVTIKINGSTGAQMWVSRYNYSNSIDVPTSIVIGGGISGAVIVSGSSGTTYTNWDFATVNYSKITGAQLSATRTANPGGGQDKAFGATTDSLGNVYVTGTMWNGSNYDVQTQKIDTALNVVWTRTLDVSGYDDAGINIALDDSLNVYLTGSSYYSGTNRELILVKYNNSGILKWTARKLGQAGTNAEGVRVKVVGTNEIFVGGHFGINSNQDVAILRYNKFGEQNLEKRYNGPLNNQDKILDMVIMPDSNFIFVSGRTYAGGTLDSNITIKYQYNDYPRGIVTYSDIPSRTENELTVSFQPSAITASVINNLEIQHGILSEFLTPTAMSALNSKFSSGVNNYPCYKVFPWMNMDDSISVSRSGNTIKNDHHWTTLGVILPNGSNDTTVANTFNSAYTVVELAFFNLIAINTATANDPEYTNSQSASLASNTLYANANINIGPAWDMHTGDPNVIVGVFDTGINQLNGEMGFGTPGARIPNGWNYSSGGAGTSLITGSTNDPRGHGTSIASIITAARNDYAGPAGVAGGDFPNGVAGLRLHDMKTAYTDGINCTSLNNYNQLASAIVQGATGSVHGFTQNIANHSWTYGPFVNWPIFYALSTAFKSQVFMALASGNGEDDINSPAPCNTDSYPRLYPDRWMTCTGANDSDGVKSNFSECGGGLDIIAPGEKNLYQTIDRSAINANTVNDYMVYGNGCNQPLSGTSQAAPHTAAVGGLMISYIKNKVGVPNQLEPEDIEEIIQYRATDIVTTTPTFTYGTGIDAFSGYGRLNAGDAMQGIKYPDYQVKHYSATASVSTAVLQGSMEVSCLTKNLLSVPMGVRYIDRYKITKIVTHSLPANYSLLFGWERDAASDLYGILSGNSCNFCGNLFMLPTKYMPNATDITSTISATGATLTGYVYGIHDTVTPALIHWYPPEFANLTGTAKLEYTLYLKSNLVGIEEQTLNEHTINVFPNPATDKIYFSSNLNDIKQVKVSVYNIIGQNVLEEKQIDLSQPNYIDVSNFKNGVYLVNLTNGGKKIVKKVIINH